MTDVAPGTAATAEAATAEAVNWHRCTVREAGVHHDGVVVVILREINGAFQINGAPPTAVRRDVLAMALTAISTGTAVNVVLANPNDPSGWTDISLFYLGDARP